MLLDKPIHFLSYFPFFRFCVKTHMSVLCPSWYFCGEDNENSIKHGSHGSLQTWEKHVPKSTSSRQQDMLFAIETDFPHTFDFELIFKYWVWTGSLLANYFNTIRCRCFVNPFHIFWPTKIGANIFFEKS